MISKLKNKKVMIPILLLAIVVAGSAVYLVSQKSHDQNESNNDTNEQINYDPPTEEELAATEDNKNRIAEEQNAAETTTPQASQTEKTKVTPIIGYVESDTTSVRANGFISAVIEEGGTCTLTLRRQNSVIEANSKSLPDAQSTVCGLMEISSNQLSTGNWTATISYNSSKYQGISEERVVEVQ